MQAQLYPKELLEYSKETLFIRKRYGNIIYISLLIFIFAVLSALPFIKTDVTIRSRGVIRPIVEKIDIRAGVYGDIGKLYLSENQFVSSGDTLLLFDDGKLLENLYLLENNIKNAEEKIDDLAKLLKEKRKAKDLSTYVYKQELAVYEKELRKSWNSENAARKDLEKLKKLFDKNLISFEELDKKKLELNNILANENIMKNQYFSKWQKELQSSKDELERYVSEKKNLIKEREKYVITAPISGNIEQSSGLIEGKYIQAGQSICVISPESELIAEVYVSPRDIGMIRIDQKVNLLLDAYDYNDWGFLGGKIIDISKDFISLDQTPVFKVKCSMEKDELSLKNGFVGKVKKGMTLQARFVITKRSLLQLLFDNVNDWLNPYESNG